MSGNKLAEGPDASGRLLKIDGSSRAPVDRPVVLLGSGRCGSTLLQSILNTNASFLIWGEHNGFLRQIADAYFASVHSPFLKENLKLTERMDRLRSLHEWTAWDNLRGKTELRDRFRGFTRSFFFDPEAGNVRWGFKEVRYPHDSNDRALQLMFDLFPKTRLIVLIREPEATIFSILSRWTYFRRRDGSIETEELDRRILALADRWVFQYEQLHSFYLSHASNCLLVRYEDLAIPETYQKLVQFLETDSFDYRSRIATVKNASKKTDPTGLLIRMRIDALRPQIIGKTRETQLTYGYSPSSNSLRCTGGFK